MRVEAKTGALALAGIVACLAAGCDQPPIVSAEQMAELRAALIDRPAPDFALPNSDGREVTLAGLRGQWVVLYFYPLEDMPGCSTCPPTEFTRVLPEFKDVSARVYGVSNTGPQNLKAFVETHPPGFELLSDRPHAVFARYAAWVESERGGQVIRTACIIDPQGVIRYHSEVTTRGRARAVEQALQGLRGEPDRPAEGEGP